jgi:AraC-like DNA-binding protein
MTIRATITRAGTSIRAPNSSMRLPASCGWRRNGRCSSCHPAPGCGCRPVCACRPHADGAGLALRALFLREDAARAGPDAVTVVAISPLLRELIVAACEQPVMWDEKGAVRHLVALALHEISHAATRPISVPACRDPRLLRVTEALLADPADARGLEALAAIAGASARTLARLFRRETGMSFQAWRRQLRLTEGLAALAQGETPARVAAAVGYSSGPAFGAAFRAVFGTTPGRSRRRR